jgi:hypothetical protein
MRHAGKILVGLMLFITVAYAFTPSRYYRPGIFTYWTRTDTSLAVNLDTANALTREYVKRLADSVASLKAGTADYVVYRLYGVLSSAASDSINLQVGVNGVYEAILPNFNVRPFNFSLVSTTPSSQVSSFNINLPSLAPTDSLFFLRVSRNDAMSPKCAVTIYKLPKNYGPDINDRTVGTFHDMVRFSDAVLPAGANRFFTLDLALQRTP